MKSLLETCESLKKFITTESEAARSKHEEHMARSIEERIDEERCLAKLSFVERMGEDQKRFRFRCEGRWGNTSRFRAGDHLLLHQGDHRQGIYVTLHRETEEEIEIKFSRGNWARMEGIEGNPHEWILDESFFDAETILLEGLERAMKSDLGRERILPLFGTKAQGELDFGLSSLEPIDNLEAHVADGLLNSSQEEALTEALSAEHSYLVQGPPGTGKTYTLARTVAAMVEQGQKVLLTAFTHRAIHQALNACSRVMKDDERIAKIGIPVFDESIRHLQQSESWDSCHLRHKNGGYLVGATPLTAGSKRLSGVDFDVLVADESSQLTIPLAILAMLRAKKYLFYGDQKQLPPVLQSVQGSEASDWSVFGSLVKHTDCTMLETTYRMNEELTRWPSEKFYGGHLHPHESSAQRQLTFPNRAPKNLALIEPSSLVFQQIEPAEPCRAHCDEEVSAVFALVDDALAAGVAAEEIGVVTPFRRQARAIKSALRRHPDTKLMADKITVDTVDRFQGQERELIAISLTASDPDFLQRIAKFYYLEQRWNVAVTRARSKVVLIGSSVIGELSSDDPEVRESIALLRSLLFPPNVYENYP